MFISDFAIKRPIVTVVAMVALVIFGLYSLMRLQTDEFPDIANPIVSVSVPYPGASPAEVEREVIDRIEEAVNGISGVDRIQSSATDGFANIIVTFVFEKDESQASQDVRDAISGIRSDLPTEMKEPVITKFDPNDLPILQLALSSTNLTSAELTRLADPPMTRRLRGINGVATVDVVGKVERQLVVQVRPADLNAKGVSVAQVAQ
ncbi:MAG: efflux RND transporter permease subunit, partial [Gemmatimonadaceae bacterium]